MTDHNGSTLSGDHNDFGDSPEAIADKFLAGLHDDREDPSDSEHEEDLETPEDEAEAEDEDAHDHEPSEDDAEDEDEGTDERDASEDAKTPNTNRVAADDDEVEVTVDGTATKFSVSQLKRLAGQEEALTRRSQEASELRRKSEERLTQYEASLSRHYQMARDAYKQYEDADFFTLSKNLSDEEFSAVREGEAAARRNLEYFHIELNSFHADRQKSRDEEAQAHIRANVAELADPVKGIKDWGAPKLQALIEYATNDLGIERDYVLNLGAKAGDAKLVKVIDRLMSLERGQKALTTKTAAPKPKPVKVLKSPSEAAPAAKPDAEATALRALKRSGSIDDAFALVMARSKR